MYFLIEYKTWPWLGTFYTRGVIEAKNEVEAAEALGKKIIGKDYSYPNSFIISAESKDDYDFIIRLRKIKSLKNKEELEKDSEYFRNRAKKGFKTYR